MEIFEKEVSKFLTPEVVEDCGDMSGLSGWRPSNMLPPSVHRFTERTSTAHPTPSRGSSFIGIAVVVTKHYQLFGLKYDTDMYPINLILNDVSRLRRWLRCKLKSDGFRRNNADWRVCWDIIDEVPGNEKEITHCQCLQGWDQREVPL